MNVQVKCYKITTVTKFEGKIQTGPNEKTSQKVARFVQERLQRSFLRRKQTFLGWADLVQKSYYHLVWAYSRWEILFSFLPWKKNRANGVLLHVAPIPKFTTDRWWYYLSLADAGHGQNLSPEVTVDEVGGRPTPKCNASLIFSVVGQPHWVTWERVSWFFTKPQMRKIPMLSRMCKFHQATSVTVGNNIPSEQRL